MGGSPSKDAGTRAAAGRGGLGRGALPGPAAQFPSRVQSRRGQHVAAVATARKLAILIWHLLTKHENYLWSRPALHARKLRYLEPKPVTSQRAAKKGRHPPTTSRANATRNDAGSSRARRLYARFVTGWNARGPKAHTGAAKEERQ